MITHFTRQIIERSGKFSFATAAEIAQRTLSKFQKRYSDQSESFEKRMEAITKSFSQLPKPNPNERAYQHPYDNEYNPINFGNAKIYELRSDMLGPEQVSPHYENFAMSRKYALTFWAGTFFLLYCLKTPDISWMARSMFYPWVISFAYLYFYLEARKSLIKPLLNRFYVRIFMHEAITLDTYYHENIEARVRSLMAIAKGQLDYKTLHNEYKLVRNESISNFLINEQVNLQNHITNRALNILKQAEAFEEINQRKVIDKVLKDVSNSIEKAYNDNQQQIEKEMFELALKGIEKNEMDYSSDPILKYVMQSINKSVSEFESLTKQQQNKLIALTEEQIQSIRNADIRARDEYLSAEPKIDGALKTNPTVAKILSSWNKTK